MKIRHPWLIATAAFLGSLLVRGMCGTLRRSYRALGPNLHPDALDGLIQSYIGIFWHENLLLPASLYGRPDIHVLISQHADGELITQVAQRLGFNVVRGSSTRGGVQAVRQCLRVAGNSILAVTPDGPRGPRRRIQEGTIYLAARTGRPIVPIGVGYCRPWRAKSWDRFAIPRLWSRACWVTGAPIPVPADVGRDQLEAYRAQVEAALDYTTDLAERWAETGVWPVEQPDEQRRSA
jgi:lysophospholipid acyltransferase (LPLAT)-like uncharacterized protein